MRLIRVFPRLTKATPTDELAYMEARMGGIDCDKCDDEFAHCRKDTEIERLRAALFEIQNSDRRNGHIPSGYECVGIARAALSVCSEETPE